MTGSFSYIELHSQEPTRAREFYRRLFGWKMDDSEVPGLGTYTSIQPGDGPKGGLMKSQNPGQAPGWVVYMDVTDLGAATREVRELGGKVLRERTEVPGAGSFAVVADPAGAVFNLWQRAA
jgi:predicted enzyme related to lactoylglutathione lyase